MEVFRVPRREVQVRVLLDDGRSIEGSLYAAVTGPDGLPGRILDRLNDPEEEFLPLATGGEACLLNKSGIVSVRVEGGREEVEGIDTSAGVELAVRIGLSGGTGLVGRLHVVMPPERSRALDYLNVASRFFPVLGEDNVTLVQKRFVVTVFSEPERA